jgi:hypothetical protein
MDRSSNRWLVKQKGTWNAVREHIYADFAQTLGICTQSSVYLTLDECSMPLLGEWHPDKTPFNVGIWLFDEHGYEPCSHQCPRHQPNGAKGDDAKLKAWLECGVKNPWDMVEARFLGFLCGMSEPTQTLVTTSHLWVQIDNELTFGVLGFGRGGSVQRIVEEIRCDPLLAIKGPAQRMRDLCSRISDVTDRDLERIAAVPDEFRCKTLAAKIRRHLLQLRRNVLLVSADIGVLAS